MHVHAFAGGHDHDRPPIRLLSFAFIATLCLVAAEFAGGYLGQSVALISDAIHNLSDVPTILISGVAVLWAGRPADAERTFGYGRAGILASFTNAILLCFVALALFWEAAERFRHPVPVNAAWMIGLSIFALVVNGGISLGLVRGRRDLNLRTLLIHNLGDALSNVGILVGALFIRSTHALWIDPALGMIIGGFVLWTSIGILRESGHILLEGSPREIHLADVANRMLHIEGVQEVHDMHIWTLGTDAHALSCHVRIPDMHMEQSEKILARIRESLAADFGIHHITIQFERAGLPHSGFYMPEPFRSTKF